MAEKETKETQAGVIIIDDGEVAVPIQNKSGKLIGTFYFHPTDIGIIDRYNKMAADLQDITQPLKDVDIGANGEAEEDDAVAQEALQDAEQKLYKACDYMFGGNMSEAFFSEMHPFSPVGGYFFCEIVLDAVGAYISKQFDKETAKIKRRTEKYTSKHHSSPGTKT